MAQDTVHTTRQPGVLSEMLRVRGLSSHLCDACMHALHHCKATWIDE
jgi:multimeric flavodoxin WrbA